MKSAAKKMGLCAVDFDDYDLGVNPVTGDKMGSKYSGLCMHPGCYKVVPHDKEHVCGRDHGGGADGCGKYFCISHFRLFVLCDKCVDFYWSSLINIINRIYNDTTRVSGSEGSVGKGKAESGED